MEPDLFDLIAEQLDIAMTEPLDPFSLLDPHIEETEPIPSACPGWYVANGSGRQSGYTSDPAQAKRRPK